MTAPVRAPSPGRAPVPHRPTRAPRGAAAAAPATRLRAGAAAPNRSAAAPNRSAAAPNRSPDRQPATRPGLRLVDDRRLKVAARRRRARATLIAGGVLVVASLFGVVVCHALLVSGQGRLDGLQQQVAEEQSRYQALRLQVAELESPARVVEEAQGRLGMVSPAEITYLTPVAMPAPTTSSTPAALPTDSTAVAGGAPWAIVKPLLGGQG